MLENICDYFAGYSFWIYVICAPIYYVLLFIGLEVALYLRIFRFIALMICILALAMLIICDKIEYRNDKKRKDTLI